MRKVGKIAYHFLMAVIVLFLLAVAGTFLPIPRLIGGQAGNYRIFTVQSGSMEPKIKLGSLIFVKSVADYEVGDIITIRDGKNTVTHRITEKTGSGSEATFRTKGDANEEADQEETSAASVVGKTYLTLPYVGYPIGYARTKIGFLLLVIIPSTIIVYEELVNIKTEIAQKFAARRKKKEPMPEENIEDRIRVIEDEQYSAPSFVRRGGQSGLPPRRKII